MENKKSETQYIQPIMTDALNFGEASTWLSQNFAEKWYEDACNEAKTKTPDAKRREVIFAIACIESYFTEWLRDNYGVKTALKVLNKIGKVGIKERWKKACKELKNKNNFSKNIDFQNNTWNLFLTLVNYRDNLLHGNYSKPFNGTSPKNEDYNNFCNNLDAGDATAQVKSLIVWLCGETNTTVPNWL